MSRVICFFVGENSFAIEREIERVSSGFSSAPEKIDADALEIRDLPELLAGQTLFSENRFIIIKELSGNKAAWDALPEFFENVSDATTLLFVESKPDKRTKTYKALKKVAETREFPMWGPRDQTKAVDWTMTEAKAQGISMASAEARHLIGRIGFDQWRLFHALEKLALAQDSSVEKIDELIEPTPEENVFALLETAIRGDIDAVQSALENLRLITDPYQTFGLLSSQLLQLSVLVADGQTGRSTQEIAGDIGANPYVLSKLAPSARKLGLDTTRDFLQIAVKTDRAMKSTGHDPWVLIETMLLKIAR